MREGAAGRVARSQIPEGPFAPEALKPIGVRSDPGSPVYAGHQPRQGLTYQSLLQDGGQPANGVFDLSFALFSAESGGAATATLQVNDLAVTNGVYTAVCNPRGTTQPRMAGCWPKVLP